MLVVYLLGAAGAFLLLEDEGNGLSFRVGMALLWPLWVLLALLAIVTDAIYGGEAGDE